MKTLRRYEFSERLADILRESRRDLRYRVTMLVASGVIPPGARGPGSPPATPDYAANLLIGVMAAPQQADTVEATRCYRAFEPTAIGSDRLAPGVLKRPIDRADARDKSTAPKRLLDGRCFGDAISFLIEEARSSKTRPALAKELYGIWLSRGYPAAAIQFGVWLRNRRTLVTQRYELADGASLPVWLDPEKGGRADPGLLHTVFLPAHKLIEVAVLTSTPNERPQPMVKLGPAVQQFAKLAHDRRYRRHWERFLSTVNAAQELAEKLDSSATELLQVEDFGANPGNLRMYCRVPERLPSSAPLVVVLHGCNQTAASYDYGTGWSAVAERHGFALLFPQQRRSNNPMRCFNWFKPDDWSRGAGEPESIAQMISYMISTHGLDERKVYVTGLSAGGAMTSVMLAAYPDLFAGGAILSGVPYRAATGLQEAFECIFKGRTKAADEWGGLVSSASTHRGPWPRVSVWHGEADATVKPVNAHEIVKQWTHVHGLASDPALERDIDGHTQTVWRDADGRDTVELFVIAGMGHGAAIDPNGVEAYGTEAPFMLDVGISSTLNIAKFWAITSGLDDAYKAPASWAAINAGATAGGSAPRTKSYVGDIIDLEPPLEAPTAQTDTTPEPVAVDMRAKHESMADKRQAPGHGTPEPAESFNLNALIRGALDAAGQRGRGQQRSDRETPSPGIVGVDIQGILSKSFEAAGLLKPQSSAGASRGRKSSSIHGIDIAGIIATSLEAAGLLGSSTTDEQQFTEESDDGQAKQWRGIGWRLLANDQNAPVDGPLLFGRAESGTASELGSVVRTVSCQVSFGSDPRLRYLRCLDLRAAANALTSASFSVLVDGRRVDDVSVTGMNYADEVWVEKTDIDLSAFANQTVEMTFEVVANSNARLEVQARAWVGGIRVEDAVMATSA